MKKTFLYITIAALGLCISKGCSDFEDMNVDPEHLNAGGLNNTNYNMVFTMTQVQALGSDWDVWRNGIIYCSMMIQHTSTIGWPTDYNFYAYSDGYNAAYWDIYQSDNRGAIREIINVVNKWKDEVGFENDYQIARIMKAYTFHRMTDLYGDIPYSEAGRLKEGINAPKYDTQQAIYDDLLKELDEAQAAISGSTSQLGSHDLYYGGDAGKWKKLANSLMLRVAMRLSKVDPAKAETWAKKALANGLFASVDDNAMLVHTDGTPSNDSAEPYAKIFSDADAGTFFISETFLKILTDANDPRIALIGSVCDDPRNSYSSSAYEKGDATPAKQRGLPVGYDRYDPAQKPDDAFYGWNMINVVSAEDTVAFKNAPASYRSFYSVPNRYTYSDPKTAPTMIVTHAETQLLLAEAAVRGWVSGSSAEDYYKAGVRAAMEQFKFYSNGQELYSQYLSAATVDAYVNALSLSGSDEDKLKAINTQYYITTFCDEYEAFANWRRSGYPELTPVDNREYPVTSHVSNEIPRRFTYPSSESQSNPVNYVEAVKRLSNGDRMDSRVWWDKE
ncbi:MAG: SusD/RagB family nutrient-binding outer membrane lipoprotein [Prevotellaceae bacterium]|jgi:hypothetical protein|nr:SusD/RagB family nutrient-binding outer membrane lipoprotein [Prevotellaceae bacterium]